MKDFRKIDWKIYNRPPFYQQWLCREDTLKLASFGDKGLADIDNQIISLKEQWDLDNTKGYFLDRIGKILREDRNTNPDKIYRMFLRLRTMLNTADGTVNDIIKIVKFIYSSREIKITPDYPAGLLIEYDGEQQDYIDYNAILAQVIGAGIGYHTKAMFDFTEDPIEINENMLIEAAADFVETMESYDDFETLSELSLEDHVYGRSAIVYGGGIEGGAQYNGVYLHNGQIAYQREVFRYTHDGEIVFGSGLSDVFASEDFEAALRIDFSEEMPSRDELAITCIADHTDLFPTARLYDSKMSHNGQYKWDAADDVLEVIPITDGDLVDTANIEDGEIETELLADFIDAAEMNEAIDPHTITLDMQDTAEVDEELVLTGNMDFSDTAEMDDEFAVSMIGYWTYGGSDTPQYTHDGSIGFNYGEIVPV
jgi:hypothetical protein